MYIVYTQLTVNKCSIKFAEDLKDLNLGSLMLKVTTLSTMPQSMSSGHSYKELYNRKLRR